MNTNLVNKVGSVGQDNLIAKLEPKALTFGVKIPALGNGADDVTLRRGTVLGINSAGKYEVYGERETKTAKFSGDGSETEFTVSDKPAALVSVAVGGTELTTGFTYAAATGKITFTAAPASGTNNIVATYYVWHTSDRTAAAILADDVTVTDDGDATAVAYRSGNFNRSAVICGVGYTLNAADEDTLRKYDIIFTDVM
jgi:hypothetical protein